MDFDIHCMFILPTELSLFNYDKVKLVLQSIAPLTHNVIITIGYWCVVSCMSDTLLTFMHYLNLFVTQYCEAELEIRDAPI